jgi:hypothetical protein
MHAGIGPAGRRQLDWCVGNARQRLFQGLLNRALANLSLPPVEGASVVFDSERELVRVRLLFSLQRPTSLAQLGKQFGCGGLLIVAAFLQHFTQNFARAVFIPHVDVGSRQIELGRRGVFLVEKLERVV